MEEGVMGEVTEEQSQQSKDSSQIQNGEKRMGDEDVELVSIHI